MRSLKVARINLSVLTVVKNGKIRHRGTLLRQGSNEGFRWIAPRPTLVAVSRVTAVDTTTTVIPPPPPRFPWVVSRVFAKEVVDLNSFNDTIVPTMGFVGGNTVTVITAPLIRPKEEENGT
ncbi:uncharacterized protein G2W53_033591 [Senna tora]|uniref:Uncharacterized protein n=1 Tax=Senna tora TaxID=362788 RepID=A0A834W750_9FABA|nr:uncharacterized protein G2W53_033591 [Senna tora]